jgi:hypothetical protein
LQHVGALALGDVADRRGHEHAGLGPQRAERDLRGEFAAVLTQAAKLQP